MGDDERGGPGAVERVAHLGANRLAQRGVERGEGLVEEDERGVGGERTGEGDALLLPAGQLVGAAVPEPAQPDEVEHLPDPRRTPPLGPGQAEGDVLAHGEVREERTLLRDEGDAAALGRDVPPAAVDDGLADPDLPPVGAHEAGDRPQQRRLAAARTDRGRP